MLRPSLFLCAAALLSASGPLSAQFVFQQNDNGQFFQDSDGIGHTFPQNDLWTQPYQTYANWNTLSTYPNGAGVGVTVNAPCHLNGSVSFQNLTVGAAGVLGIDSGNSGGAGNSAITVTMAAGGAGTLRNDGTLTIAGADQNTTVVLASSLTLTGSGPLTLTNGTASVQGPGTLGSANDTGSDLSAGTVFNESEVTLQNVTFAAGGVFVVSNYVDLVGTLTNNGFIQGGNYRVTDLGNGATLDSGGRSVLINAASIAISGPNANFSAVNSLKDNQGSFVVSGLKQFSNSGDLSNEGTVDLGAGSTLHVAGVFVGTAGSTLAVTVGGTQSQGAQSAGVLQVSGAATLGGNLVVTLAPGTQIAPTDQTAIASAAAFANVVNGERVATSDGSGTFQVNYGAGSAYAPGTLILSDFEPTGTANIIPAFLG